MAKRAAKTITAKEAFDTSDELIFDRLQAICADPQVFKPTSLIKPPGDEALRDLAYKINAIRNLRRMQVGPWEEGLQRRRETLAAINVIERHLPHLAPDRRTTIARHQPGSIQHAILDAGLGPAWRAIAGMQAAIAAMKDLPFLFTEGRFGPETDKWDDVVDEIAEHILTAMASTNRNVQAIGYGEEAPLAQFVSRCIAYAIGESISAQSVRKRLAPARRQ